MSGLLAAGIIPAAFLTAAFANKGFQIVSFMCYSFSISRGILVLCTQAKEIFRRFLIMSFREINCRDLEINPFAAMNSDVLIIAPNGDGVNPMTAGWGGFGVMWGLNVTTVVVRPQRFTYELLENTDTYTIACFRSDRRDVMKICGSSSGRDTDKMKECGFTMGETDGFRYIEQADIVFCCKKIYVQDMEESCFVEKGIAERWYPDKDYHRTYVGEIVKVLVRE